MLLSIDYSNLQGIKSYLMVTPIGENDGKGITEEFSVSKEEPYFTFDLPESTTKVAITVLFETDDMCLNSDDEDDLVTITQRKTIRINPRTQSFISLFGNENFMNVKKLSPLGLKR